MEVQQQKILVKMGVISVGMEQNVSKNKTRLLILCHMEINRHLHLQNFMNVDVLDSSKETFAKEDVARHNHKGTEQEKKGRIKEEVVQDEDGAKSAGNNVTEIIISNQMDVDRRNLLKWRNALVPARTPAYLTRLRKGELNLYVKTVENSEKKLKL